MSDELDEDAMRLIHLLAMLGTSSRLGSASSSRGSEGSSSTSTKKTIYREYVLVAAIDFGTTFSGYAFSFKNDKTDIKMNKNWGAEIGFMSYKTPTCILLNPDGTFKSFGYEAQQEYATMMENDDQKYSFFERFKMKLHNIKDLNKDTVITATNGQTRRALDIFSLSLTYLKDHLTSAISQAIEGSVEKEMIRWVITVPAIWSDASKQFMREATLQAGLIEKLDSNQLIIALEPEAASLYVRSLEINQFARKSTPDGKRLNMKSGTQYLVIDAGGGTLDITVHELLPDGKVKELHYATGGSFGGTRVDDEFIKLMEDIFGKDYIDFYRTQCPSQWLTIISEFEKKKRMRREGNSTNIQLTWHFGEQYMKMKNQGFDEAFKQYKGVGVRFANGVMCMSDNVVRNLFKPVTDGITAHIEELLQQPKLQNVKYFFCVGGFSESTILQEALHAKFGHKWKILIPEEASLAVVKGAVQFGHEPDSISSRIAAKTYGVETMTLFLPFIHKRDKAVKVDDRIYCKDVFRAFVKKGEEVPVGHSNTTEFSPVTDEQQGADVEIYSADNNIAEYITDDEVEHHGKIHVMWPGSGRNRKLKITMTFGGTEVQVSAIAYPGEYSADTKINFLTE